MTLATKIINNNQNRVKLLKTKMFMMLIPNQTAYWMTLTSNVSWVKVLMVQCIKHIKSILTPIRMAKRAYTGL